MKNPTRLTAFIIVLLMTMKGVLASGIVCSEDYDPYIWFDDRPHDLDLHFTKAQKSFYRSINPDLLKIFPVADSIHDSLYHIDGLGYCVGNMVGETMVLAYYPRACHWGCDDSHLDPFRSACTITTSKDDGRTWSTPFPADIMQESFGRDRSQIGWGLAISPYQDHILVASKRGIFRSYNEGESWERLETAFSERDFPEFYETYLNKTKFHYGPVMINHPVGGLMILSHVTQIESGLGAFYILHSTNGGEDWDWTKIDTGNPGVTPVEPTAVMYGKDNRIFVFTRNGPNGQGSNPAQMFIDVLAPGEYEISGAAVTNCEVGGHQDTHDVIYNPWTDSFEAVVSNRGSGEFSDYDLMELTLYSIPREEAEAGNHHWTYRGHLIEPIPRGIAEGSHPGGSFIHNGYHYIPFHRGDSHDTRSSVYLMRRTLDTDALSQALPKLESHKTEGK